MQLGNPEMLWLLALAVPLLVWFFWWSWRKKHRLIAEFVQGRLLANLMVGVSKSREKLRLTLLALAVTFALTALTQPQWGFVWEEATQKGIDVVVAIDTSRSMLAEDVKPNRLVRSKLAAVDLMDLLKSDRLGLVAFAGTAFLQCPLTLDTAAFRQSVEVLETTIIPQGGSALSEALEIALDAFEDGDNHRAIVLFSDGEDHESGPLAVAGRAKEMGVRIYCVGAGTTEGDLLREPDPKGELTYIKDAQGNVVRSRLNEVLLTRVATVAEGFYLPLDGVNPMKVLYERGLSTLPAAELSSKVVRRHQERYQWPLALALLCLMAETFFPERRRFFKAGGVVRPAIPAIGRLALFFLVLGSAVPGWSASPKTAASHFERADYQAAQNEYERLLEESPDDPRLHYNAGVSAYRAGAFPESAAHFQSATISRDLRLQQRAYYNLGNSFFRIGEQQSDPAEKTQSWEQSIGDYEAALKLDPQDSDAHFNLDLVRKKLEELKQQQQQQQSQPNQDQDEKNQDQSDSPENENQPPQDEQPQQSEDSEQQPQQQPEQSESNPEEQPNSTPKDESGNDESPASPQPGEQEPEKPDSSAQKSAAAQLGQMTPEQARQLLDAQRQHEQPLIFVPPEAKRKSRPLKDW